MWLARIQPDKPGYDRRTFECPVCHDEMVVVVKYGAVI
jgi:transcription elongation factor Elf1